jgi:hypothetical protein
MHVLAGRMHICNQVICVGEEFFCVEMNWRGGVAMPIFLLDDSWSVEVYYDQFDCEYEDNICMSILEDCPDEEKLLRAGQTSLYLTKEQARQLGQALLKAAEESCQFPEEERLPDQVSLPGRPPPAGERSLSFLHGRRHRRARRCMLGCG